MAMEKFLADQMLLRLGRWLRLSGHDVLNPGDADDPELAAVALKENRTLITRDRGLKDLCTRIGASCILIRSNRLQDQLGELASAGVVLEVNPRRCTICNGPLALAPEGLGLKYVREVPIWRCEACGKLYWEGSHWSGIRDRLSGPKEG